MAAPQKKDQTTTDIKDLCESPKGQKRKHEDDDDIQIVGSVSSPTVGRFLLRQRLMQNVGPFLKLPPGEIKKELEDTKLNIKQLVSVKKEICNLGDNETSKLESPSKKKKVSLTKSFTKGLSLSNSTMLLKKEPNLDLSEIGKDVCINNTSIVNVLPNEKSVVKIKTEPKDSSSELVRIKKQDNTNSVISLKPSTISSLITRIKPEPEDSISESSNMLNISTTEKSGSKVNKHNSECVINEIAKRIKKEPEDLEVQSVSIQNKSDSMHSGSNQNIVSKVITKIKQEPEDSISKTISNNTSNSVLLPDSSSINNESHSNTRTVSVIKNEPVDSISDLEITSNKSPLKSGRASPELFHTEMHLDFNRKQEPVESGEPNRKETNSVGINNVKVEPIDDNIIPSSLDKTLKSIKTEPSEVSFNTISNLEEDIKPDSLKGANALRERLSMYKPQIAIKQEPSEPNDKEEIAENPLCNTVENIKEATGLSLTNSDVGKVDKENSESELLIPPDKINSSPRHKLLSGLFNSESCENSESEILINGCNSIEKLDAEEGKNISIDMISKKSIEQLDAEEGKNINIDISKKAIEQLDAEKEKEKSINISKISIEQLDSEEGNEKSINISSKSIEQLDAEEGKEKSKIINSKSIEELHAEKGKEENINISKKSTEQQNAEEGREEITNISKCSTNEVGDNVLFCMIQNGIVFDDTDNSDHVVVKNFDADLIPLGNKKYALTANIEDTFSKNAVSNKRYVIVNGAAKKCSTITTTMKIKFDGIWSRKQATLVVIVMWTGIKPKSFDSVNGYPETIDYFDVEGNYGGNSDNMLKFYIRVNESDLTLQCADNSYKFLNCNSNSFIFPNNASVSLYIRKKSPRNSEPIWTILWLILDLKEIANKIPIIPPLALPVCRTIECSDEIQNKRNDKNDYSGSSDKSDASSLGESKDNIIPDNTSQICVDKDNPSFEQITNKNGYFKTKCRFIVADLSTEPNTYLRNWQGILIPKKKSGSIKGFLLKMTVIGNYYTSYIGRNAFYIDHGTVINCCESQIDGGIQVQFDAFYCSNEARYIILAMWVGEKHNFVNNLDSHPIWIDSTATYCIENNTEYYLELPTEFEKTQKVELTEFQDILGEPMEAPFVNGLQVQVYANSIISNAAEFCSTVIVDKSFIESQKLKMEEEKKVLDEISEGFDNLVYTVGSIKTLHNKKGIAKINLPKWNFPKSVYFNLENLYVNGLQVESFVSESSVKGYLEKNKYYDSPWTCILEQKGNANSQMVTVELMWIGKIPASHPVYQNWTQQCKDKSVDTGPEATLDDISNSSNINISDLKNDIGIALKQGFILQKNGQNFSCSLCKLPSQDIAHVSDHFLGSEHRKKAGEGVNVLKKIVPANLGESCEFLTITDHLKCEPCGCKELHSLADLSSHFMSFKHRFMVFVFKSDYFLQMNNAFESNTVQINEESRQIVCNVCESDTKNHILVGELSVSSMEIVKHTIIWHLKSEFHLELLENKYNQNFESKEISNSGIEIQNNDEVTYNEPSVESFWCDICQVDCLTSEFSEKHNLEISHRKRSIETKLTEFNTIYGVEYDCKTKKLACHICNFCILVYKYDMRIKTDEENMNTMSKHLNLGKHKINIKRVQRQDAREHNNDQNKFLWCEVCFFKSSSTSEHKKHISSAVHTKRYDDRMLLLKLCKSESSIKPIYNTTLSKCTTCMIEFINDRALIKHLSTMQHCNLVFSSSKERLLKNLNIELKDSKPCIQLRKESNLVCMCCQFETFSPWLMDEHLGDNFEKHTTWKSCQNPNEQAGSDLCDHKEFPQKLPSPKKIQKTVETCTENEMMKYAVWDNRHGRWFDSFGFWLNDDGKWVDEDIMGEGQLDETNLIDSQYEHNNEIMSQTDVMDETSVNEKLQEKDIEGSQYVYHHDPIPHTAVKDEEFVNVTANIDKNNTENLLQEKMENQMPPLMVKNEDTSTNESQLINTESSEIKTENDVQHFDNLSNNSVPCLEVEKPFEMIEWYRPIPIDIPINVKQSVYRKTNHSIGSQDQDDRVLDRARLAAIFGLKDDSSPVCRLGNFKLEQQLTSQAVVPYSAKLSPRYESHASPPPLFPESSLMIASTSETKYDSPIPLRRNEYVVDEKKFLKGNITSHDNINKDIDERNYSSVPNKYLDSLRGYAHHTSRMLSPSSSENNFEKNDRYSYNNQYFINEKDKDERQELGKLCNYSRINNLRDEKTSNIDYFQSTSINERTRSPSQFISRFCNSPTINTREDNDVRNSQTADEMHSKKTTTYSVLSVVETQEFLRGSEVDISRDLVKENNAVSTHQITQQTRYVQQTSSFGEASSSVKSTNEIDNHSKSQIGMQEFLRSQHHQIKSKPLNVDLDRYERRNNHSFPTNMEISNIYPEARSYNGGLENLKNKIKDEVNENNNPLKSSNSRLNTGTSNNSIEFHTDNEMNSIIYQSILDDFSPVQACLVLKNFCSDLGVVGVSLEVLLNNALSDKDNILSHFAKIDSVLTMDLVSMKFKEICAKSTDIKMQERYQLASKLAYLLVKNATR